MAFGGGGVPVPDENKSLAIQQAVASPPPVPIVPKALAERDAEETEQQRRARQNRRRGIQSLRIDPVEPLTGLSIPQ